MSIQSNIAFGSIKTFPVSIDLAMDVRRLRYFSVLAEEKHFGRAAKKLALSQPPLSYAIKQLESELGAQLFTRNTRAVELTPAGLALRTEARALLGRMEEIKQQIRSVADGSSGVLRIGFGASMLYRGLPAILRDFRERFPLMEIRLKEMGSIDQTEAISRDEIDLGFGHGHARREGMEGFLYHSEPFVACLHESHPLARRRRIGLTRLSGEDFVLFARHGSPAYYELIVNACVAAGFVPKVRHEVAYWLTVLALVANGTGVALVPRSLRDSRLAGLCFVGLENAGIVSETYCVWKRDRHADPLLQNAIALMREHRKAASRVAEKL